MAEGHKFDEVLGKAMLSLEKLTRDCFEIARLYWVSEKRSSKAYRDMEHQTDAKIALCLHQILGMVYKAPGSVFFAPRYRGMGTFKSEPGEGKRKDDLRGSDFTWQYGSLVRDGVVVAAEELPFMPVAFWSHQIYETPLVFIDESWTKRQVKISGFSGWTAEHGFLGHGNNHENEPIFGFHFSRSKIVDPTAEFLNGLLHFNIPENTPRLGFTKAFKDLFYKRGYYFYRGGEAARKKHDISDSEIQKFPVIHGLDGLSGPEKDNSEKVAEAVFSTLFYSNFQALQLRTLEKNPEDWADLLPLGIADQDKPGMRRSLADVAAHLFSEYRSLAAKGDLLTFAHYYAFLLNPSINFRRTSDTKDSPIGTVNVYTDKPIPPILAALIRKHLESIYHFLRELEDWEDATREATDSALGMVNQAMGHEVVKVYSTARALLKAGLPSPLPAPFGVKERFVLDIADAGLHYGLIWGNYVYAAVERDALLWDEFGNPCDLQRYSACLARESWRLFLAAEVFKGQSESELRDGFLEKAVNLWNFSETVSQFVKVETIASLGCPSLQKAGPDVLAWRTDLNRALYRWMMAVLSNAWKHLTRTAEYVAGMSSADRIDALLQVSERWAPVDTCHAQSPMTIDFRNYRDHDDEGIEICVWNEVPAAALRYDAQRNGGGGAKAGTELVMLIAGQDILQKVNAPNSSLDEVRRRTRFERDNNGNGRWISSLRIPSLSMKPVGINQ